MPTRSSPRLFSPALLAVFAASFGGMVSFHLLLSVVPLYTASAGAGEAGAGAVTGALLLATVATEFVTPRLVARFGARLIFAVGLVLLGAPAFALTASAQLIPVVAVSAVRGVGFGLVVVVGATLVAALVPADRRGLGLGLYGVALGVPGVVFLPFGLYLIGQLGYPPVLVAGAVAALLGVAAVPGLPGRAGPAPGTLSIRSGLRMPGMRRPALVFAASAMAAGVVVTFVPLAVGPAAGLAAVALLIHGTAAMLARWWAGWYGDRHGPGRLLIPALLVATGGAFGLVATGLSPLAVLAAMALLGVGFGVLQNASLVLMFRRVPAAGYPMVGAVWNLAFDAAMGFGALGFGVLVGYTGYSAAFGLMGLLMAVALVPAWRDREPAPPARAG